MVRRPGNGCWETWPWLLTLTQEHVQFAAVERPQEMLEKSRGRDAFFSVSTRKHRPNSVYTEFMESDTEIEHGDDQDDSEVYSEFGDLEGIDDGDCSPRISIGSVSAPPESSKAEMTRGLYTYSMRHSPGSRVSRPSRHMTRRRHQGRYGNAPFHSNMNSSSKWRDQGGRICFAVPCRRHNR